MSTVGEIEQETVEVKGRIVTITHHHPRFSDEAEKFLRREQIEQELYRIFSPYCGKEEPEGK